MKITFPAAANAIDARERLNDRLHSQLQHTSHPTFQSTLPPAGFPSATPIVAPQEDRFISRSQTSLKFRGVSRTDKELIDRFPPACRPIFQKAHDEAAETGASEITAEHLIWAMISSLDEAVNWHQPRTRQYKPMEQEKQRLARQLADALMPDADLEPKAVTELFNPLSAQLHHHKMQSVATPAGMLNLQPELRSAMSDALDATLISGDPVALLTKKILWSDRENGAFYPLALAAQHVAETHRALEAQRLRETGSPKSMSSDMGMDFEDDERPASLYDTLQEKSPVLGKWVQAASSRHAQTFYIDFKPAPLSAIVAKGVGMALQELSVKRKQPTRTGGHSNQNKNLESLNALISPIQRQSLEREHLSRVLNNALKKLQALPVPENEDAWQRASANSRQVFEHFLTDDNREDFSLGEFVRYLKDSSDTVDGLPGEPMAVGRILSEIVEEAQDKRLENMDQFERACPMLLKNGVNLVRKGMNGQLDKVLMRREATDRMLAMINSGGSRTSLLLNAASGEGKTFAVLGLAQRLADNDVPKNLQGMQLIQLDLASMVSGTSTQGSLEFKAKTMVDELNRYLNQRPDRHVLIFIDEVHALGTDEGKTLLDIMKSSGMLERKNLTFIGATTPEDWRKSSLKNDSAFQGRFHDVALPGFNQDEKLAILGWNALQLQKKSGVEIPVELLEKVLTQASAKWPENALRHSIDLLNLATSLAAGAPLETSVLKDRLQRKELWLETLKAQKTMKGRFARQLEEAADEVDALKNQLRAMSVSTESSSTPTIKDKHVRQALAILTGETIGVLSRDALDKLRHAREIMAQHIVGQSEALSAIEEALREIAVRQKTGGVPNRPIASMLLPGPTGVGKTEAAKVIAKEFMNGKLIRLDMSDYAEKHDVSRLTGAPPGYIGYDNGGLVDQVRKNPNSVIVFDEIEKAHPDIFNVLLPILEEGELRDNQGQPVSFRNAVVVLTSNLNNSEVTRLIRAHQKKAEESMGDIDSQLTARDLETQVRQLLTANPSEGRPGFKPEHLGRIDYVIPFSPLTQSNVADILNIRLRQMNQEPYLRDNNLQVQLTPRAQERLINLTAASTPAQAKELFVKIKRPGSDSSDAANAAEELPLQSGARDVRNNFERFISKMVFTELTYNADLTDLENARLVVDYNPSSQSFGLNVESQPVMKKPGKTEPFKAPIAVSGRGSGKKKISYFA